MTSRLLPPLLDLVSSTTTTSPSPGAKRASPCPRAVASALQALHRLLRCVTQTTRASEVGVDTTRLGHLHPLHGLDHRALRVLLDIVQTTGDVTTTSDTTTITTDVASASAVTPYPQALSLHQLAAPLPSASTSGTSPTPSPSLGASAGGVLAGALMCLRALIASTFSTLTLSSTSDDASASASDGASTGWHTSLVRQAAHIAVTGRRKGDISREDNGGAGEEEVGHVKAAALGLLAELLAQDNNHGSDSGVDGVDGKEDSVPLMDVCMNILSQYLSSPPPSSESSRNGDVALSWSLSAVQVMAGLAVAATRASYQHRIKTGASASTSSSSPAPSLRMLHLALPQLLHTATIQHSTTRPNPNPNHAQALGLSALQAIVSLLPGETQETGLAPGPGLEPGLGPGLGPGLVPGSAQGLAKGLGPGLGWDDCGSSCNNYNHQHHHDHDHQDDASSEAATAIALHLAGNLLAMDIRTRASTDGSPIIALLHLAILYDDTTTTGTVVGQLVRRLFLALAHHATQPDVAKAVVAYILELEKSSSSSLSLSNSIVSPYNRGVVVLTLLSSALCHLRQDSFHLATATTTTDPSSPVSIDVVERMTSLAIALISTPTPGPSPSPGSIASSAAAHGLALLARRLPSSPALDALLTRVHALLAPPSGVQVVVEADVVMGVYVEVMKALLMRSDLKMTSVTDACTSCWQDHFVASLLILWNTTSTSSSPSTDTDTIVVSASSMLAWAAALAVPTVFHQSSSSSSSSSSAPVPLLWRQRAWSRLAHPLLALVSVQEPPSASQSPSQSPSSLSQSGLLALCGMIVALGQVALTVTLALTLTETLTIIVITNTIIFASSFLPLTDPTRIVKLYAIILDCGEIAGRGGTHHPADTPYRGGDAQ